MEQRNEMMQRMASVVNRPEWDDFLVWVDSKRVSCHERLEGCTPDNLRGIQGELRIVKEILNLRASVNNIVR